MAYTTINKSTDYFNTKLYTGNNGANAITGVGFQPDFVWLKPRNYADHHRLMDAVRGQYTIYSNRDVAQDANSSHFTSFDSDGFTLAGSDGGWNSSSYNYVSWNWKANGQGSSNTDGTINTTYTSVNTTSGFSISKVTLSGSGNQTFGHGLGVTPSLVIFKCTSHAESWKVYHSSLSSPESKYLQLNTTDDAGNASNIWGAGMTSSTVGVKVGTIGTAGQDYVAYCFAEKTGFSKFGLYQGNSNADGAFIYTGFKPAWVIIKQATGGNANEVWGIRDNVRDTFNPITKSLVANADSAEGTTSSHYVDFVSNGFKIRTGTENALNTNYGYVYLAFAEAPLVGSNNVPATAR